MSWDTHTGARERLFLIAHLTIYGYVIDPADWSYVPRVDTWRRNDGWSLKVKGNASSNLATLAALGVDGRSAMERIGYVGVRG
jgi:hypothetical protein